MRRLLALLALAALLAGCQTDLPLVDLKERYGTPPSRFLPMDGIEVHWRDEGPGGAERPDANGARTAAANLPTVLLLHGAASSLHTWDGWARQLSPQFRVVRLDLPGFGLTGPHPSGDYSGAATVDFLERFADAAGMKRFAIVGNSLGGYYAWRFALRHPGRVSALILVDPLAYPLQPGAGEATGMQLARMPVISELMRYLPIRWAIERSLQEVYADDAKVTPELVDRYEALMLRPGNRAAFGDRARAERRPVGAEKLRELRVPTLIMWGAKDPWLPLTHGERLREEIRDSRLVVYPELGHLPMEEDPSTTARDAAAFLRGEPVPGQK